MTQESPLDSPARPETIRSPWRIFSGRLLRNRVALIGGSILFVLYAMAIFGSFIGPYDPNLSHVADPDHHPTDIRFIDAQGNFHLRPFVYRTELTNILRRVYEADETRRYPIRFFVAGEPYKLWWLFETELHLFGLGEPENEVVGEDSAARITAGSAQSEEPPRIYLFGTDRLGRDNFSRILSGAKISLSIGLIGIMITMTLGLLVGGLSGYLGGMADTIIMRLVELLMSIPGLYLILALRAALSEENPLLNFIFRLEEGKSPSSWQMYLIMITVLSFVGWAGTARVIRGMVLAIKELDYVAAAHLTGIGPMTIMIRHILPNVMRPVLVLATVGLALAIIAEATLSFLGVGMPPTTPSLGTLIRVGGDFLYSGEWWITLFPALVLVTLVLAVNLLGDWLRDALDPKLR